VTLLLWSIESSISLNGPIMPLYVKSLGIGPVGWGVLASAWALGMFLTEWIWGSLSDSRDRRYLILLSALSMSVLFALFTVRALIPLFIVLELLSGAMGCALGPTTRAYVTDESPEKSVGLFASLWWTAFMLGQVIGPIAGSFIAETWSFEYSFYASSLLAIVMAVFVLTSLPTSARHRVKRRESSILSGLKFVLGLRSVRLLFLSAAFVFIGRSLIIAFLPLYASSVIKMPLIDVGILIATFSGTELVSMPALGWLSDRFGLTRTAFLSYAVSAFLFLLYFQATTTYQIFLVSIAVGVGLSGLFLLLALIPTVTSIGTYGKVIGAYGSFEDLGIMIGPIIYGFVWTAYGPVYIFLVCALAHFLAAFLVLGIRNAQKYRQH
jgi:DHA1 family multidrug resistance protein-like MFS transporter